MALLLAGTLSLGVGAVLGLQDDDDRSVVAQDLGSVPGSPASLTASSGPLSGDIPVLAGLDDPAPAADPVPGGFEAAAPVASRSATAQAAPGAPTAPGVPSAGSSGAPTAPGAPAAGSPGAPSTSPAATPSVEPGPELADPTQAPVAPRPSPRPMPRPETPLGPKQPWLVSSLYPLPDPPPSTTRTPLVPAQLDLPARSVTASVDAVGTDPSGGMVVPEQVRTVGWWAPGVLPGGTVGSAVIAGHVDSRTQGVGVLSVLPQLTQGEPVLVRDAAGRTATFRVAARREYGKYDLPRDVFRRDGAPQLVLITCGGRFDPAARSYESNIVVYAVPA